MVKKQLSTWQFRKKRLQNKSPLESDEEAKCVIFYQPLLVEEGLSSLYDSVIQNKFLHTCLAIKMFFVIVTGRNKNSMNCTTISNRRSWKYNLIVQSLKFDLNYFSKISMVVNIGNTMLRIVLKMLIHVCIVVLKCCYILVRQTSNPYLNILAYINFNWKYYRERCAHGTSYT